QGQEEERHQRHHRPAETEEVGAMFGKRGSDSGRRETPAFRPPSPAAPADARQPDAPRGEVMEAPASTPAPAPAAPKRTIEAPPPLAAEPQRRPQRER